jgi:CRP-like cAMP-binding protein
MEVLITDTVRNGVLKALPDRDLQAMLPDLERVNLSPGQRLYEGGKRFPYLYFPEGGICSYLGSTADGSTAELASVGRENVTGLHAVLGAERGAHDLICSIGGEALRLRMDRFTVHLEERRSLRLITMRCALAGITMLEQMVLCSRHHVAAMRLARWLLLAQDRIGDDEISATQELLSKIIGAHRPAVNAAARQLHRVGAISSRWGKIAIRDRKKLERLACECYAVLAREFAELEPGKLREALKLGTRSPVGAG